MESTLRTLLRFLLAWLAQTFVFHHLVLLDGWITPLFSLYALVLLPLRWRPIAYLLIGGAMGVLTDLSTFGGGLFTAAGLMSGLLQPWIARLLAPREGYEAEATPDAAALGWGWMLAYTFLVVWAHALWLFLVEAGRWDLIPKALGQSASSAALTTVLILGMRSLFNQNGSQR